MKRPKTRLRYLRKALNDADRILILPHNNPDPDAIASAVALRYLLTELLDAEVKIGYRGVIGRAENHALVRYLNHPLDRVTLTEIRDASHVVLVDTQPATGNNSLPDDAIPAVVIDHHPFVESDIKPVFSDVRPPVGSASTMLAEYLHAADLPIDPNLATALFYGIQTDTLGLQRGAAPLDQKMFCHLLPQVEIEALARIQRAQVSPDYFRSVAETLDAASVYGNVTIAYMGELRYPDLTADMADFLLRMRGCQWVICMGVYKETLFLAVRTEYKAGAGELVRKVVGERGAAGGHGSMAGGQVVLNGDDPEELAAYFHSQFLDHLSIPPDQSRESLV